MPPNPPPRAPTPQNVCARHCKQHTHVEEPTNEVWKMQVDFSDIMNKYLEIDGDDTLKR